MAKTALMTMRTMKTLSSHLLDQAESLASAGQRKPRQADLRRAVSASYYALFHLLIDLSTQQLLGSQPLMSSYRAVTARAYSHKAMKDSCRTFAQGSFEKPLFMPLPNASLQTHNGKVVYQVRHAAIIRVARLFKDMQEKRHQADYDLSQRFERSLVKADILDIRKAIQDFENIPTSDDERKFFLVCLLTWKQFSLPE